MKSNSTYFQMGALSRSLFYALLLLSGLTAFSAKSNAQSSDLVWMDGDGLSYTPFAMEGQTDEVNAIPDFSHAGYKGGGVALPQVPVVITLSPSGEGDDTGMIQAAIDEIEAMEPDSNGFRGAVLLLAGCYEVDQLSIEQSGVVIRGEGQGLDGTVLHANLQTKHDFIILRGSGSGFDRISSTRQDITTPYVPLGAYSFDIEDASGYTIGDTIT
ncbi:MAG: hypothetical protein KI786_19905 [Mameliella sp.]|nr:hypothetical protein [Phaeodactylibacter sp.]